MQYVLAARIFADVWEEIQFEVYLHYSTMKGVKTENWSLTAVISAAIWMQLKAQSNLTHMSPFKPLQYLKIWLIMNWVILGRLNTARIILGAFRWSFPAVYIRVIVNTVLCRSCSLQVKFQLSSAALLGDGRAPEARLARMARLEGDSSGPAEEGEAGPAWTCRGSHWKTSGSLFLCVVSWKNVNYFQA